MNGPHSAHEPTFLYDGECGFCTQWAGWLAQRSDQSIRFEAFQNVPFERYGLSEEHLRRSSYLIDEAGNAHRGARGFSEALKRGRGLQRAAGLALANPLLRAPTSALYALIARNRHRLPAPRSGR